MKVLVVVPIEASIPGSDLGGVITNVEQIMCGLKEAGHDAQFVRLRDAAVLGRDNVPSRAIYTDDQWVTGPGTGFRMHTILGWQGPYYTTGVESSLQEFIDLANSCDVIIWGAMFGFQNEYARRNPQWLRCFSEVSTPAVVIINDDYFWDRQAWTSVVDPYVTGWASVHPCGFDLSEGLAKPRAIILNAHDLGSMPVKYKGFKARSDEVYMVQNWKSWKRGDRLVRAVPHMESQVTLAGNGIELRYMMAEEKCKPTYYANKRNDPQIVEFPELVGRRIWENAEACPNFRYIGAQTEAQRDKTMSGVKFLADLSERDNSGMFNRVFLEAAKQGCATLALEKFMSGVDGSNKLFQPNEHYFPVSAHGTPAMLAGEIEAYMTMKPKDYSRVVEGARERLHMFDRKLVAQQLVSFALGKRPKGVLAYSKTGQNDKLLAMGRANYESKFGEIK